MSKAPILKTNAQDINLIIPNRTIVYFAAFSILLILIQVTLFNDTHYLFLLWNLFLAWIPFSISKWIYSRKLVKPGLFNFILYFFWFIFFPNAPYILTDYMHLIWRQYSGFVLLYNFILISAFAFSGLLFGLASLDLIQRSFNKINSKISFLIIYLAIFLSSIGIYIGRVLRWNSWDMILRPRAFIKDLVITIQNPNHYLTIIVTIILFTGFLSAVYHLFRSVSHSDKFTDHF